MTTSRGILAIAAATVFGLVMACVSVNSSDSASPVTEPGGYTKAFVDEAIERYEDDGLDAALDYYNSTASVNGDWYVFIIDEGGAGSSPMRRCRRTWART